MISADGGRTWTEHAVPDSTGCVHMDVGQLPDGTLLALFRSRWADSIYASRSHDRGRSWSAPKPPRCRTTIPRSSSRVLANGHLALVFNDTSAADVTERRASLYDDIEDDVRRRDAARTRRRRRRRRAGRVLGRPARADDAGHLRGRRTHVADRRNLEIGDGYCMTNNSREKLNREYSYPSSSRGRTGRCTSPSPISVRRSNTCGCRKSWVRG